MPSVKQGWKKLSLLRKLMVMILCIIVLSGSTSVLVLVVMNTVLDNYESDMYQNSICYELQKALEDEAEKFLVYTRESSTQSKSEMEEAFINTKRCIEELPFDYAEIGKERYAITWNIRNGYEGYVEYRDQLLSMSEEDPE